MRIPSNPYVDRLTKYANGQFHIVDKTIREMQRKSGGIEVNFIEVAQEIDRKLSREVGEPQAILDALDMVAIP